MDKKPPLPEGWRHTYLPNHLWYQGKVVVVRQNGSTTTKLIASCGEKVIEVEDQTLEKAIAEMEQRIDSLEGVPRK